MILLYIALTSLAAFALFGWDKACARGGRARVPEAVLLGLCLIGGSIGGLLGMRHFRHKTSKTSFQVKFWGVVLVQFWLLTFAPDSLRVAILRVVSKLMS